MAKIFFLLFIIIVIFFLVYLIEEGLYEKFLKLGDMSKYNVKDIVKKVRGANEIFYKGDYQILNWNTGNNLFRPNFSITLVFDKNGQFKYIANQCFYDGAIPNVFVGVAI